MESVQFDTVTITFDLRTKSCVQAIDDQASLNWYDSEALRVENDMYIASQMDAIVRVFGILNAVFKLNDSTIAVAIWPWRLLEGRYFAPGGCRWFAAPWHLSMPPI